MTDTIDDDLKVVEKVSIAIANAVEATGVRDANQILFAQFTALVAFTGALLDDKSGKDTPIEQALVTTDAMWKNFLRFKRGQPL